MAPPLAAASDAQLDALFSPLHSGELQLPVSGRVLILRARDGAALRALAGPGWLCQQSFKPFADRLRDAGLAVGEPGAEERFALVLVLPPRQRDEARALFARAARHVQAGGSVLAAMPNAEGAKSTEADFSCLFGPVRSWSRRKCRVFHACVDTPPAEQPLAEWASLDAPRRTPAGYLSRAGLFAWDRVDAASALLAAHLPDDLYGRVADLGAGYGYLATQVVARCAGVSAVDLYEAEARALEVAQVNLTEAVAASGREVTVRLHWHDVTAGLAQRYDAIVSNPPFHQGRADQPELGRAFIASAAAALQPGGRLWLVANRHLPYEATLAALFDQVHTVTVQDGFKVIEAVHA